MENNPIHILEVSASGRGSGSVSRQLTRDLISALEDRHGNVTTLGRDLSAGVPFVDEAWIEANFTPEDERSQAQRDALAFSNALVRELEEADVLVIGAPMYNFSIPAALKAWVDMITRARLTFRYTEDGPEGLLTGKKAYVVVATGGVTVGSPMDFATPYLRHLLAFVGISDVEIIAADRLGSQAEDSIDAARARIAELVHLENRAA